MKCNFTMKRQRMFRRKFLRIKVSYRNTIWNHVKKCKSNGSVNREGTTTSSINSKKSLTIL
jgi:hypothetical protein